MLIVINNCIPSCDCNVSSNELPLHASDADAVLVSISSTDLSSLGMSMTPRQTDNKQIKNPILTID